jgi:hypothetical protein
VGVNLDDVPRGYICPVLGGEVMSVLTLLLCIRLLDALEAAARSGEAAVLDVDRQCFSVIVLFPRTGRTLRANVWPRGPRPGEEVPSTLVWLDEQRVESFPQFEHGRMAAWRKLLQTLVSPVDESRTAERSVPFELALDVPDTTMTNGNASLVA